MKKYLIIALVAVMSFVSLAPVFAKEEENRGREIGEVKKELRDNSQELKDKNKDKAKEFERAFKIAPRALTLVGTLASVNLTTTTSSTAEITVHITGVFPGTPKHWPSSTVSYPEKGKDLTLKLNTKTSLLRAYGGKMKLSEMAVGDEVRVVAKFEKNGTLRVSVVKDNSLHIILNRKGTVESIDAANGTFVLKQEKRTLTVKITAATKFTLKGAGTIGFADLKVGDKVKVEGIVNLNTKTVDTREVVVSKRETPATTTTTSAQ